MTKEEFFNKWAVRGMPADKNRLVSAAWDAAVAAERAACSKMVMDAPLKPMYSNDDCKAMAFEVSTAIEMRPTP